MNKKKDYSPEEKLLRLIRSAGKKGEPRQERPSPGIEPAGETVPKLEGVARPQGQIKPGLHKQAESISIALPFKLKNINTRTLNLVLLVVLFSLLLYFVYDLFYTSFYKKGEPKILTEEETHVSKIEIKPETLEIKPYSYYSSSIEDRNIFMPQLLEAEEVVQGPTLEEVRAGLSLIGIIAGERPQAIIEDRKAGKSYFLYEGGTVAGAEVVDILEDSVVMEYQGQRFQLVL